MTQLGDPTQRVIYESCRVTADGNTWSGRIEMRGDLYRLWFVGEHAEFRIDMVDFPPYVTKIEIKR